jgi:DegV family protein with EDD domain
MYNYIIVTESGADLPREIRERPDVHVLPMHVSINNEDYLDGSIPIEELCSYYDKTGKTPTTSAVNPEEYRAVFEQIRREQPEAVILHISYSSACSCTYQNAVIGDEGIDNLYHVDTLNVSAGEGFIVMKTLQIIEENPAIAPEALLASIKKYCGVARFSFIPGNLDYLRAGGRVSNAQYLGASLLNLKPLINIIEGKLISAKKYRGSLSKIIPQFVNDFFKEYDIDRRELCLIHSNRIKEELKTSFEEYVRKLGAQKIHWLASGSVITTHAGPGGIGIAGFEVL